MNLLDHVLPRVPLKQFVFTVPWELRARLAYDGELFGAIGRIFVDSLLGFYRKRLAQDDGVVGQSGAVIVVQRVSSDLRLNPHLHVVLLDGVFVAEDSEPVFHPLERARGLGEFIVAAVVECVARGFRDRERHARVSRFPPCVVVGLLTVLLSACGSDAEDDGRPRNHAVPAEAALAEAALAPLVPAAAGQSMRAVFSHAPMAPAFT